VRRIVRECNRTNEKFTDPDFDIESDDSGNCLNGLIREDRSPRTSDDTPAGNTVSPCQLRNSLNTLAQSQVFGPNGVPADPAMMKDLIGTSSSSSLAALFGTAGRAGSANQSARRARDPPLMRPPGRKGLSAGTFWSPGSIHRVGWIFESPQFTVDGYSSSDIKQGADGDCWWLAAVATIAHRRDLMDRVCVARDEECGVYGFVLQRDGEWVSTVVDDNLYLTCEDFDFYGDMYDSTGRRAREHRKASQTGSKALYFAKCADQNETWLPLLEKAYAKVHGDFEAINGGWSGEAVEDMTGGVSTTVATNRVLRKDRLWMELVNPDGDFAFALSAMGTGLDSVKGGLALGHAYSILKATEEVDEEGKKVRLVKIR
ncbi:MAG: calpain family cysteine protease, partial [Thaumarchaeota archaeon]|nr:calpain family cysteine protease [Nitrososphaerota archaeon]